MPQHSREFDNKISKDNNYQQINFKKIIQDMQNKQINIQQLYELNTQTDYVLTQYLSFSDSNNSSLILALSLLTGTIPVQDTNKLMVIDQDHSISDKKSYIKEHFRDYYIDQE